MAARNHAGRPPTGKVVGRVYQHGSEHDPPGRRWFWSITTIVPAIPNKTNGYASTRDEAMQKFRTAWEQHEKS